MQLDGTGCDDTISWWLDTNSEVPKVPQDLHYPEFLSTSKLRCRHWAAVTPDLMDIKRVDTMVPVSSKPTSSVFYFYFMSIVQNLQIIYAVAFAY